MQTHLLTSTVIINWEEKCSLDGESGSSLRCTLFGFLFQCNCQASITEAHSSFATYNGVCSLFDPKHKYAPFSINSGTAVSLCIILEPLCSGTKFIPLFLGIHLCAPHCCSEQSLVPIIKTDDINR